MKKKVGTILKTGVNATEKSLEGNGEIILKVFESGSFMIRVIPQKE